MVPCEKMVANGYKRKNAPKHNKKGVEAVTELDWSFKYSNEDLRTITKTMPISDFVKYNT